MTRDILGPYLVLDTVAAGHIHLAALFAAPAGHIPPPVVTAGGTVAPGALARVGDTDILRARFALPLGEAPCYSWNGRTFQLAGLTGDLRIAYVT